MIHIKSILLSIICSDTCWPLFTINHALIRAHYNGTRGFSIRPFVSNFTLINVRRFGGVFMLNWAGSEFASITGICNCSVIKFVPFCFLNQIPVSKSFFRIERFKGHDVCPILWSRSALYVCLVSLWVIESGLMPGASTHIVGNKDH